MMQSNDSTQTFRTASPLKILFPTILVCLVTFVAVIVLVPVHNSLFLPILAIGLAFTVLLVTWMVGTNSARRFARGAGLSRIGLPRALDVGQP